MTPNDAVTLAAGTADQAAAIPDLVWSTGPASYAYIFGGRALFDAFIAESWRTPDTYFAHTEATVALHGGAVVGLELGSVGTRNHETKANLAAVSMALVERGVVTPADLAPVLARADKASWLNPFVPPTAYYVLALAVAPDLRGTGLGARLLAHAAARGRSAGCRELHLDVLSDNPAVAFYRARGLVTVAETVAPEPLAHGVPMEMRMVTTLDGGTA